jgi:hypothetical protein
LCAAQLTRILPRAIFSLRILATDEDEAIIHGLHSSTTRRLLFEPESTSSIVKTKKANPYGDFRRSMEEMVLSHGAGD